MQVAVAFGEEQLVFDVPDDRVVGVWHGPEAVAPDEVESLVREALEAPVDFPPLCQAVVPGDNVVLAFDPRSPAAEAVLRMVCVTLQAAGVAADSITVLVPPYAGEPPSLSITPGVKWSVHDPSDRTQLAYLAASKRERRIYLNRAVVDADCVVPIGPLGYDPALGYRGPWSVLFPDLSDDETMRAYRAQFADEAPRHEKNWPALEESAEVSWLLGSQFPVGLLAGVGGLSRVIAGQEASMRKASAEAVDAAWSFRAGERAELVVVGIGQPGASAVSLDELAAGLATATRLVGRGGKIVALSRAKGAVGPALQRLIEADDPRPKPAIFRGVEGEFDYPAARQLAGALAWADVYLLSEIDEDTIDDLSMIALARPEEARKLAASSPSSLFVSRAELTRGLVAGETT